MSEVDGPLGIIRSSPSPYRWRHGGSKWKNQYWGSPRRLVFLVVLFKPEVKNMAHGRCCGPVSLCISWYELRTIGPFYFTETYMPSVHCVPMFSNTFCDNSLLLSELLTSKFLVLTLLAWTCWKVPISPRWTVQCQSGWMWPIPGAWTHSFVLERDCKGRKCCSIEPSSVSLWGSSSCGMRSVLREEFHPHFTEKGTGTQRGLGISPKPYKIPPSELFPLWHHLWKWEVILLFLCHKRK